MKPLSQANLEAIYQHALEAYPEECCGVVIGEAGQPEGPYRVRRCQNIQNDLHRKDPERYPRDARTAYFMNPMELFEIFTEMEKRGEEFKAFYHSHPDHKAYFSAEDKAMATNQDGPTYPNALYIVVSVYHRQVHDIGFFEWDEESRDFVRRGFFTDRL